MFWGHLSEMLLYRASEATTFVNTCRLASTDPHDAHLDCRVGGGAPGFPNAGHRPPLKPCMQISRTRLSRRRKFPRGQRRNESNLPINEWTFLAPVGLIQSTSLLGRERTGFSLKELFRPPSSLLIWFPFSFLTIFAGCLSRPIRSPVAR
jgi:hypothetical protein